MSVVSMSIGSVAVFSCKCVGSLYLIRSSLLLVTVCSVIKYVASVSHIFREARDPVFRERVGLYEVFKNIIFPFDAMVCRIIFPLLIVGSSLNVWWCLAFAILSSVHHVVDIVVRAKRFFQCFVYFASSLGVWSRESELSVLSSMVSSKEFWKICVKSYIFMIYIVTFVMINVAGEWWMPLLLLSLDIIMMFLVQCREYNLSMQNFLDNYVNDPNKDVLFMINKHEQLIGEIDIKFKGIKDLIIEAIKAWGNRAPEASGPHIEALKELLRSLNKKYLHLPAFPNYWRVSYAYLFRYSNIVKRMKYDYPAAEKASLESDSIVYRQLVGVEMKLSEMKSDLDIQAAKAAYYIGQLNQ